MLKGRSSITSQNHHGPLQTVHCLTAEPPRLPTPSAFPTMASADSDHDHDNDNFSSVSWSEPAADNQPDTLPSTPGDSIKPSMSGEAASAGAGHDARTVGEEKLDCTVGSPVKENDGTKDAFISYLITTNVR